MALFGLLASLVCIATIDAKTKFNIKRMQEQAKDSYGKGCDPGTEFALACDALKRINEYDKKLSDDIDGLERYQIITDQFYYGTKWDAHLKMENSISVGTEFKKNLACSIAARKIHNRGFCPVASATNRRNFKTWSPYARCSEFYDYVKEDPTTAEFHYAMDQLSTFNCIPYEEFGQAAKPNDPLLIIKEMEKRKRQEEQEEESHQMITKRVIWK